MGGKKLPLKKMPPKKNFKMIKKMGAKEETTQENLNNSNTEIEGNSKNEIEETKNEEITPNLPNETEEIGENESKKTTEDDESSKTLIKKMVKKEVSKIPKKIAFPIKTEQPQPNIKKRDPIKVMKKMMILSSPNLTSQWNALTSPRSNTSPGSPLSNSLTPKLSLPIPPPPPTQETENNDSNNSHLSSNSPNNSTLLSDSNLSSNDLSSLTIDHPNENFQFFDDEDSADLEDDQEEGIFFF